MQANFATGNSPRENVARAACSLPMGRRCPRGTRRWYPVHVPRGQEAATAAKLKRVLPPDAASDAFAVGRERWFKRGGAWELRVAQMFPEYLFVESEDVQALRKALARLSFPASLATAAGGSCAPLDEDARAWLACAMDDQGVVRASRGCIQNGQLHVTEGPLVGQEARVQKIDRHKRACVVRVCGRGEGYQERLALEVPDKR